MRIAVNLFILLALGAGELCYSYEICILLLYSLKGENKMWFEPHVSGIIGGIIGGSIGVLGGIWGTMAGLFSRKGKHKKLVLSLAIVLIILGVISLCTGIIALIMRQPYHVWYPFALFGFLLTVILLPNYFNIKKTYTRSELNKMSTDDLS